jgi:diguanylate cyclase (GGDEF)-like protein/PAS domain S-box-containing protein
MYDADIPSRLLNDPPSHDTQDDASTCLLVVEDESIVALDLADQLSDMGYRVCATVDNGHDALACAQEHAPDLVLMDIVIKGDMDGVETAHRMAQLMHVPVVFLTAYSDNGTVMRAAQTAPYGYLTKPFQARELRAAIEVALYKATLERRLRESEQWFSATLRCVADGVLATDAKGQVKFMNPAAEHVLKLPLEQALGRQIDEIIVIKDAHTGKTVSLSMWDTPTDAYVAEMKFENLLVLANGQRLPVDSSTAPIRGDDQKMIGTVIAFRDISERLAAAEALRQSEERFRAAFDLAPVGMALVALNGRFMQGNGAIFKLLNYSESVLYRLTQADLSHPEDLNIEKQHLNQLLNGERLSVQFEKRYRVRAAEYLSALVSVSLLTQKNQPLCYLYQVHDLTVQKEAASQLARLAHFDPLTGLTNRARMRDELERMILAARRSGKQLAVVFLDLDHFKRVNDTLGHEAGDTLLQVIAQRLLSAVRESDCVARLGGDEFVLLLPNIEQTEDVSVVTNKVGKFCSETVTLHGQQTMVGVSMGVSLFPDDGTDAVSLLRSSDSALYHAKELGRGNAQFYRPELTERVAQRVKLERELHDAIERKEFVLYYQPIIPLNAQTPLCIEALIRWQHPSLGLLQPSEFIDFSEENGLIVQIGAWSLQQACHDAVRWVPIRPNESIHVAVNISVRQFAAGNLEHVVREALVQSGLAPERLYLEITEPLLADNEQSLRTLKQIKAMGVNLAIDDFGVGHSSLSDIKRLGPAKIKIHGSFVRNVVTNADDAAVVRAIIAMGKSLRMSVVAECVTTEAQRDFLVAERCDAVQGFLYAEPCPVDKLSACLNRLRG